MEEQARLEELEVQEEQEDSSDSDDEDEVRVEAAARCRCAHGCCGMPAFKGNQGARQKNMMIKIWN